MRSKSLAGHEVGLARLSAKLIAFLEPVLWVGISHGLSLFFPYFKETNRNPCALRFPHFALSDTTNMERGHPAALHCLVRNEPAIESAGRKAPCTHHLLCGERLFFQLRGEVDSLLHSGRLLAKNLLVEPCACGFRCPNIVADFQLGIEGKILLGTDRNTRQLLSPVDQADRRARAELPCTAGPTS